MRGVAVLGKQGAGNRSKCYEALAALAGGILRKRLGIKREEQNIVKI